MPMPEGVRARLLHGLSAAPIVVGRLLASAGSFDSDHRPDPERYSIREIIAHLADWDTFWLDRLEMFIREDEPALPLQDPDEWVQRHHYAAAGVEGSLDRFRENRSRLIQRLKALTDAEWERTARLRDWTPMTLGEFATLMIAHDGYHTRQLAEWLTLAAT